MIDVLSFVGTAPLRNHFGEDGPPAQPLWRGRPPCAISLAGTAPLQIHFQRQWDGPPAQEGKSQFGFWRDGPPAQSVWRGRPPCAATFARTAPLRGHFGEDGSRSGTAPLPNEFAKWRTAPLRGHFGGDGPPAQSLLGGRPPCATTLAGTAPLRISLCGGRPPCQKPFLIWLCELVLLRRVK